MSSLPPFQPFDFSSSSSKASDIGGKRKRPSDDNSEEDLHNKKVKISQDRSRNEYLDKFWDPEAYIPTEPLVFGDKSPFWHASYKQKRSRDDEEEEVVEVSRKRVKVKERAVRRQDDAEYRGQSWAAEVGEGVHHRSRDVYKGRDVPHPSRPVYQGQSGVERHRVPHPSRPDRQGQTGIGQQRISRSSRPVYKGQNEVGQQRIPNPSRPVQQRQTGVEQQIVPHPSRAVYQGQSGVEQRRIPPPSRPVHQGLTGVEQRKILAPSRPVYQGRTGFEQRRAPHPSRPVYRGQDVSHPERRERRVQDVQVHPHQSRPPYQKQGVPHPERRERRVQGVRPIRRDGQRVPLGDLRLPPPNFRQDEPLLGVLHEETDLQATLLTQPLDPRSLRPLRVRSEEILEDWPSQEEECLDHRNLGTRRPNTREFRRQDSQHPQDRNAGRSAVRPSGFHRLPTNNMVQDVALDNLLGLDEFIDAANKYGPDFGTSYFPDINPTIPNPESTNSQDQPFDVEDWMAEILAEPGLKMEGQEFSQLAMTMGSQEEPFDVEDWTAEMLGEPVVSNTEKQEEPSQSTTTAPRQEESFGYVAWVAEMTEDRARGIEELERKELRLKSLADSKFDDTSDTLPQSNQVLSASGMEKEEGVSKAAPTLAEEGWMTMPTGSAGQKETSSDDWLKYIADSDYTDDH
ncbi:hypothetical protein MMC14_009108 [Varicellaria rhodocarpa]|nr:hypothetical protein [Varicellaria rhodocarpa]